MRTFTFYFILLFPSRSYHSLCCYLRFISSIVQVFSFQSITCAIYVIFPIRFSSPCFCSCLRPFLNTRYVCCPQQHEGMPYDFQWGVQDEDSGNTFSHVENSDGQTTQGEYRVLLPDGRTQVVKFFDNGDGYNAEVTYEK
ncbi:Pro-resilin [Portunus trituberculatus]|uniref:Pro-resilin n=1 Tax=Portunus trituberculatus TaxID=210409 RepID=A0A5B7GZC3_PORTR|nr:Pro-resilin [Portunus trituberculatus]